MGRYPTAGRGHALPVDPQTVLRGLSGLFQLDPQGDWRSAAEALTDLLWHGMSRHR